MDKPTILFIDDELSVLLHLKHELGREPYQVLTAQSFEEGLRLLEVHSIQLVFVDYYMPDMNGIEFLNTVKERYPAIIRCMLSGVFQEDFTEEEIKQIGIHYFFKEILMLEELDATVRKELGFN